MPRFKRLLNPYEAATDERLSKICRELGARVFVKQRLAEVLPIDNSGIDARAYRFALQSHFDFVVADADHDPLFAVEFDGNWHEVDERQRARDRQKDALCERFDLPLLRINSAYLKPLARRMDMLTWLVDVWFMQRSFMELQDGGSIPFDEPFMPSLIIDPQARPRERFRWFLSDEARESIRRLHRSRKCMQPVPSRAVACGTADGYHAIASILVTPDRGVIAETRMRPQRFYVPLEDLLEDIVVLQLYEKLEDALKGGPTLPRSEIDERCAAFRQQFHIICAGGSVPSPS